MPSEEHDSEKDSINSHSVLVIYAHVLFYNLLCLVRHGHLNFEDTADDFHPHHRILVSLQESRPLAFKCCDFVHYLAITTEFARWHHKYSMVEHPPAPILTIQRLRPRVQQGAEEDEHNT